MGALTLPPEALSLAAGPLLVPIWAAFALAPRAFPQGRTLVPAVVAALAFAGLNPSPAGYGASILPFLSGGDHNAFAAVYLVLAAFTAGALWVAALAEAGPRWSRRMLVAAGTSAALAAVLAAAGIVGLPLAQPRVESVFASAFAEGATGLSDQSELGEFGALAQSRRRVLDLQTSLPSEGHFLLASQVFTRFDGRRWTDPETRRTIVVPPAPPESRPSPLLDGLGAWFPGPRQVPGRASPAAPAGAGVELRVTQAEVATWPLLLPRGVVAVTAESPRLELDRFLLVRRPGGVPLRQYGAVVAPASSSPGTPALSDEERAESLALPSALDPRVAELARQLAPPAASPRERLVATVRHLQTGYRYTLAPGPFRAGGDALAEFLFEKKAAYCEYFATAAVVLLRLQAVPARFVKGLSVGAQTDAGGGLHVVRESDAHAWIEAWVPAEGWVEQDPTPPGQFEGAREKPDRLRRLLEHARAALGAAWARLAEGGPLAFLRWLGSSLVSAAARAAREPLVWLTAGALVLAGLGLRLLRQRRRMRSRAAAAGTATVPADLRALVRELERKWTAHGRGRPRARGLLEHAANLRDSAPAGAPPVPASLLDAGSRVVSVYYRARFGAEASALDEVRRLRDELAG
jgi:transglutaminase-like putative cysteine protease